MLYAIFEFSHVGAIIEHSVEESETNQLSILLVS